MSRISILGIPIDVISQRDVLLRIAGFCKAQGQFHIATPNPEMLVEAQKNPEFKNVLQHTALNIPDGVGLVWAMGRSSEVRRFGGSETAHPTLSELPSSRTPERVTGTDTLIAICSAQSRLCPPERVFLLGAAEGVAERAAAELIKHNPALNVVGTFAGSPKPEAEEEIVKRINESQPTILFVAYGAPQQDLWIARNLSKLKTVKVAMGVGGAFDFLAGKQKRAPKLMRKLGIEWLWRLIREPRRVGRIWRAVVVFPWLVARNHSK